MKKTVFIISCFCFFAFNVNAQSKPNIRVDVQAAGVSLTADNISISPNGCTLEGNVTQQPIMKFPYVTPRNVPGILTNIDQVGSYWVIQCTAGPGFCFTWYDPR